MIKLGLLGGRGYVGQELLRLLAGSADFQVQFVGSSSWAGKRVSTVFEECNMGDLAFSDLSPASIQACPCQAWVIAQPNGVAQSYVSLLSDPALKIVDISSDFRFDSDWTYGLPESNARAIAASQRVANPGCYATAAQLALLPLKDQLQGVPQIFGVSGYSGAGRKPSDKNDPKRLAENLLPYSLTNHTHEREISHQLGIPVQFMPHVSAFFRGISLTISIRLSNPASSEQLLESYQQFYRPHPLVDVVPEIPEIASVANTNLCRLGGFTIDPRDHHRVIIVSVIDNLRKGAATQVVQNLNLMFGFDSVKGLET